MNYYDSSSTIKWFNYLNYSRKGFNISKSKLFPERSIFLILGKIFERFKILSFYNSNIPLSEKLRKYISSLFVFLTFSKFIFKETNLKIYSSAFLVNLELRSYMF